jgi:hypothetical protein
MAVGLDDVISVLTRVFAVDSAAGLAADLAFRTVHGRSRTCMADVLIGPHHTHQAKAQTAPIHEE